MDFKRAKKKAKRIRRERTLLLIYAVAVTAALFVSIYNNNSVKASISYDEEFEDVMEEDFDDSSVFSFEDNLKLNEETLTPQTVAIKEEEEQTKAEEVVATSLPGVNEDVIVVEKGDTFISLLTKLGLEYAEANKIYNAYKKVYDAKKIKVGQAINVTSLIDDKYSDMISISKIMIEPVSGTRYILEKTANGVYEAKVEQDALESDVKAIKGIIQGNVSSSMKNAGVPQNIIGNFINIFSFSVDFRRDVKAGDSFEVRYERELAPDGKVVKTGDIVYAALTLGKKKTELYRFKSSNGSVDYYDEKGLALKKTLDKKPLEFRKARISSKFGRRFHPILKEYRMHSGIDYAAPVGTKVYASADGTVMSAKWMNGYGNYVVIRHNSEYSTGYAHLKSYAKGIKPGTRVKQGQVIAYVGSTGRSTGPHLHFEIIRNGKKVDPLTIKAATGENLTGQNLTEFKKIVAKIKNSSAQETQQASTDSSDKKI